MKLLCCLALSVMVVTGFAQGRPPMMGGPMTGQMGAATGDGSRDPKVLVKLEKEYKLAQATFTKHPKDMKAKDRFVTAGVKFGHESMVSPLLSAHVKYRQALHIYKQVLKVDPTNPVAKPEADMMIRIYKQLGRPIPD